MIVVADTSPLNYLILLGQQDVLRTLYGRVAIPHDVYNEMRAVGALPEVKRWIEDIPLWTDIISVLRLDDTLPEVLGDGEISRDLEDAFIELARKAKGEAG